MTDGVHVVSSNGFSIALAASNDSPVGFATASAEVEDRKTIAAVNHNDGGHVISRFSNATAAADDSTVRIATASAEGEDRKTVAAVNDNDGGLVVSGLNCISSRRQHCFDSWYGRWQSGGPQNRSSSE